MATQVTPTGTLVGGATMRAVGHDVYGGPEVLALRTVARPTVGTRDVLVAVRAAGVNPADCAGIAGEPYVVRVSSGLRRPRHAVPGHDMAGVVVAVGSDVTAFRPGDEVFGAGRTGTFAEYAVAHEDTLATVPAGTSLVDAAAVPMAGLVALQALRDRAPVHPGQRVLVTGAGGGIGTFAIQVAAASGAEVTGVCSAGKADLVRSLGAHHVIDHATHDFTAGDDRWDVILDNVSDQPLSRVRRALTPDGTLVPNGGQFHHRWTASLGQVVRATVTSPFLRQELRPFLSTPNAADLATLADLLRDGVIRPVVDRTLPLSATGDAIAHVAAGHATGKVVLTT